MLVFDIHNGDTYSFSWVDRKNFSPHSNGTVGGQTNSILYTVKNNIKLYVSYETIIGIEYDNVLYTNDIKYSSSTLKHQSFMRGSYLQFEVMEREEWKKFVKYIHTVSTSSEIEYVKSELTKYA